MDKGTLFLYRHPAVSLEEWNDYFEVSVRTEPMRRLAKLLQNSQVCACL